MAAAPAAQAAMSATNGHSGGLSVPFVSLCAALLEK